MDDFLSKYEVIGGKYREALQPLQGGTGATDASLAANASRLDRLRAEMAALDLGEAEEGEDPEMAARRREKERILAIVERQWKEENSRSKKERAPKITILEDERRDRWDCETVLSALNPLTLCRACRLPDFLPRRHLLEPVEPPSDAPPARCPRPQACADQTRPQDGLPHGRRAGGA